jgi:hypothetical protein
MRKSQEVVVFTGPSLSHQEARAIFGRATYMPPIRRGDAFKAFQSGAKIIGIIDGAFFQDVAVSPRELLYLLDKGVVVVGGGSMGALRAAELDEYGMIGVGEVYRMYKRGEIFSDDEVALIFNPVTLEPLSEPLVNIRFNVKKLKEEGLLSPRVAEALIEIAKALPYPERGYERILSIALGRGILDVTERDRLLRLFKEHRVDLKKLDTIEVVKKVAQLAESFG